eukprot:scaffold8600_cov111-Cylindrotheca_fusiformis.AAC.5
MPTITPDSSNALSPHLELLNLIIQTYYMTMKARYSISFWSLFLFSTTSKGVNALDEISDGATSSHQSRQLQFQRILKDEELLPYQFVAAHKGGLFGAVPPVALRAREKMEALEGVGTEEPTGGSNTTLLPRDVPLFALEFVVSSDGNPADNDGNYNELQIVTEEYLEKRFGQIFEGTPAIYKYTTVSFQTTNNPLLVYVTATVNIQIPGDVPTFDFLSAQAEKAFETPTTVADGNATRQMSNFTSYMNELSLMSDTNPFQSTKAVYYSPWDPSADFDAVPSQKSSGTIAWTPLALLFGALVIVVLTIAVILWRMIRNKTHANDEDPLQFEHDPTSAADYDETKYRDNVEHDRGTDCSTSIFGGGDGTDEESPRHFNEVRTELLRENSLQEVSLVSSNDTNRIGELKRKPEPIGSYDAPRMFEDEEYEEESVKEDPPSNLAKFENLLGRALGRHDDETEYDEEEYDEEEYDEEEYDEEEYEEEEYEEEEEGEGIEVLEDTLISLDDSNPEVPTQNEAPDPDEERRDFFSFWQKREVKTTSKSTGVDAPPTAEPKKDLFSFWEKRSNDPPVDPKASR